MTKQLLSGSLALTLVFTFAPIAFANTITIESNASANVTNDLTVTANTGDNTANGSRAGHGGDGGDATVGDDDGRASAGDGGNGARGGDGGAIRTGDAIATGNIMSEVNTTEVEVIDNSTDENQYDEYISEYARTAAEMSMSSYRERTSDYDVAMGSASQEESDSHLNTQEQSTSGSRTTGESENWLSTEEDMYYDNTRSSAAASSQNGGNTTSNQSSFVDTEGGEESNYDETSSNFSESVDYESESSSEKRNTSASANTEETYEKSNSETAIDSNDESASAEDVYQFDYTRIYVGSTNDRVSIGNTVDATVVNAGAVVATTGGNTSNGNAGSNGGSGGDATTYTDDEGVAVAGDGGHGAVGGNGGSVRTGVSDSFGTITTTQNRTMTRIVRN